LFSFVASRFALQATFIVIGAEQLRSGGSQTGIQEFRLDLNGLV